ncbi:MAG: hypothetical protein GX535_08975 [Xanthomonadaceae bacterium]|nr:hypothetical protein [Xanthomonadaceae bacterium]
MSDAPIGRFLEISVQAPDIRESLSFYETLGFEQLLVGEVWPYPYAVVTDGRLYIGLHAQRIREPTLTFVLPDLRARLGTLESLGIDFDELQVGTDVFNHATFLDPNDQRVCLVEARTFSPPSLDAYKPTTCGYFTEYGIPVRDPTAASAFWEPLGFVAMEEAREPFPRTELTSNYLNLAFYRSRALRHPVLTFQDEDMRERLARLRERGMPLSDEMPDALDDRLNGILISPEGTRLLLMQVDS